MADARGLEGVEPTPAQWVDKFLALPREEQENVAENIARASRESITCFMENHKAMLRHQAAELAALRQHNPPLVFDHEPPWRAYLDRPEFAPLRELLANDPSIVTQLDIDIAHLRILRRWAQPKEKA